MIPGVEMEFNCLQVRVCVVVEKSWNDDGLIVQWLQERRAAPVVGLSIITPATQSFPESHHFVIK
jgi:hypothetical protein